MFSFLAAASLAIAGLVSASPVNIRQTWQGCANGTGVVTSAQNFQLAAWNFTGTNANATGAPLTVGFHQFTGDVNGTWYALITTQASYLSSTENMPTLSLVDGALLPTTPSGTYTTDLSVSDGQFVQFEAGSEQSYIPAPVDEYCLVEGKGEYPWLAVNGNTQGWYICEVAMANDWGHERSVVYRATANTTVNNEAYSYDTCYAVRLQVVFEN